MLNIAACILAEYDSYVQQNGSEAGLFQRPKIQFQSRVFVKKKLETNALTRHKSS